MLKLVKKIMIFSLCFTFIFSMGFGTFTHAEDTLEEYHYTYKRLKINSNVELQEDRLDEIYTNIMSTTNKKINKNEIERYNLISDSTLKSLNKDIVINTPINGGGSTLLYGPKYKDFNNRGTRIAAEIVSAWFATKVPTKLTKNTMFNFIFNRFTNWSSNIKDTYTGAWIYKSYSNYYGLYIKYGTLVHYSSSSHKTPINVEYYEIEKMY